LPMVDVTLPCFGAALFSLVFLFLWRQSGVTYFAYWSLAFVFESLAWVSTGITFPALMEFGFTLCLVMAARAGPRVRYLLPVLVLAFSLIGRDQHPLFFALRSLVLAVVYLYSLPQPSLGPRRLLHFTLLALSAISIGSASAYLLNPAYLSHIAYVDLALKTVLPFSAMAMWIENQNERVAQITQELDRVRRDTARDGCLDSLTGILNQDSFRKRIDTDESFKGVAVVCDLDDLKSINDQFGHVVGDEVLRNVGNLLRSSIRAEDVAFRWGGDEFAILFRDQEARVAQNRMAEIEARLKDFRVRGYTSLQISFSWGVAEGNGVPLREVLEQADREMYANKRARGAARPVTKPL
jgi:diguanylate cyclase (GGDEF)-like protein